jgi:hypothetical protein
MYFVRAILYSYQMLYSLTTVIEVQYTRIRMERYEINDGAELNLPEERDLTEEPLLGEEWGQPYMEAHDGQNSMEDRVRTPQGEL